MVAVSPTANLQEYMGGHRVDLLRRDSLSILTVTVSKLLDEAESGDWAAVTGGCVGQMSRTEEAREACGRFLGSRGEATARSGATVVVISDVVSLVCKSAAEAGSGNGEREWAGSEWRRIWDSKRYSFTIRFQDVKSIGEGSDVATLMRNSSLKFVLCFQWHNYAMGVRKRKAATNALLFFLTVMGLTSQAIMVTKRMNAWLLLPTQRLPLHPPVLLSIFDWIVAVTSTI